MGVLQNMYVFEQGYLEKLADALKGDMCSTRMSDIFARRAQNDILGKGELEDRQDGLEITHAAL